MLNKFNQGKCNTNTKLPNSLLKNIHKNKVKIKTIQLKNKANCFIKIVFLDGTIAIIKIEIINTNKIINKVLIE